MDRNTKQLMAVFSLMLGLSWGIPYMVSETSERNSGWLMLTVFFLLLALGFYLWIKREERTVENAAQDALDAAEENLKKLEAQAEEVADKASDAVDAQSVPVADASATDSSDDDDSVEETSSAEQVDDNPSVDEIEEVAEDAQDGDVVAEAQIADASAAPDTPDDDASIEMDNDSADDSALAESHSSDDSDSSSVIDVLIEEEVDEIVNDAPADADDLEDDAETDEGTIDLTIIEGIGPKYQEILNGAGITTFAQIAEMSEDEIVTLVKENGGRKAASMTSWAEQAQLAAAGDWDALAKLQDELSGGRR